ncbi:MAG: hypothetical protein B7Z72_10425 [Gemmatimonadetes bacterium 21-71-4]|nr:MAG: hypothetical protein B7Z72_10425 [Gemmatimonadetes bacterium 21-71-4]
MLLATVAADLVQRAMRRPEAAATRAAGAVSRPGRRGTGGRDVSAGDAGRGRLEETSDSAGADIVVSWAAQLDSNRTGRTDALYAETSATELTSRDRRTALLYYALPPGDLK